MREGHSGRFVWLEMAVPEPLGSGPGSADRGPVPAPLAQAVIGGIPGLAEPATPPPATLALLDAAKHRFIPELLEASGLPHACLFQGQAAEAMRDVAPWLVALAPGHPLTRALFTDGDGPADLWRCNLGPILRCAADFDEIRRQLRRFVRLRRAGSDEWLYFRFWEGHVLESLAASPGDHPSDLAAALLAPVGGAPQAWLVPDAAARRAMLWRLRDPALAPGAVPPLHDATVDALAFGTMRTKMIAEIDAALLAASEEVRSAYADEPRLAELWSALLAARFDLPGHRIDAIRGYLTLAYGHRQDEAWHILTRAYQGPRVRLWHLEQALGEPA